MKIVLVFDVAYGADPQADIGDAFWLVESPSNRALAMKAWQSGATDSNSAVFDPPAATPTVRDVLERVRDVELHHPDWTDIVLVGVEPTALVRSALAEAGHKVVSEGDRVQIHR